MTDETNWSGRVLVGAGEMAALMRSYDWASTPLGPVAAWPQSLRTTVGTVLGTRHPMFLWWGPELIQFYNDAYRQSLGSDRHPSALGQRGRECWAEIWPAIGPQIEAVMQRAEATWNEDHLVPITRGDHVEDVYWSYSYSPVRVEDGRVGGVLVTVQETTKRVIGARRTRLLRELAVRPTVARSARSTLATAAAVLRDFPDEVPFGAIYARDAGPSYGLVEAVGASPVRPWPDVLAPDQPTDARVVLVPIPSGEPGADAEAVLIAGLNARIPFDRDYREFLAALGEQLSRVVAGARADEAARRRAETLSAELDRLADLFEQAPGFLAVLRGANHVFELTNPGYQELIGGREVIGRPIREALPEIEGQGYFELLDRVLATGEPHRSIGAPIKLRLAGDGPLVQRYVDFIYQRIEGTAGAPPGIFLYGNDATERHDAWRALAASERRYRLLAESIPQIVWISNADGVLEYVSPGGALRLEAGVEVTLETSLLATTHPEDAPAAVAAWREALASRGTFETELRARRPGGQYRWLLVRAVPFQDEETAAVRWFGTGTDVEDSKLAEQQLHHAQRLKVVATLAGGVAHEINNQMTVILGFGTFLLQALGRTHPQAPDLELVLRSAERAARVSQQLLAFSRQQTMQPRSLDLAALVADLHPVMARLLGEDKRLIIAPTAGPGLAPVLADAGQVQQVLINLVANARDATDTGGEVTITLEDVALDTEQPAPMGESVAPGRYVRLSVADTGTGMLPETVARIFEPFFTTKDVGAGTGLGLSMVHGTLRRHGGYVRVRSAPGAGTAMELYWPAATVAPAPEAAAPSAGEVAPGGEPSPSRIRVLVAEDEPAVRVLAVRTLEEAGFEVVDVADGRAAMDALERGPDLPDVVVTDVTMPTMNGRQLSDAVRARWPALPVLFMSGHAGESDVYRRLVPADASVLQKPFLPDALVEAVRRIVEPERAES